MFTFQMYDYFDYAVVNGEVQRVLKHYEVILADYRSSRPGGVFGPDFPTKKEAYKAGQTWVKTAFPI